MTHALCNSSDNYMWQEKNKSLLQQQQQQQQRHQQQRQAGSGSGMVTHSACLYLMGTLLKAQRITCIKYLRTVMHCCFAVEQDFRVPREIVWLNGAPGSGKVRFR